MKYKLVAIDMDGTLLTPELEISKETVSKVRQVIEKGVKTTLVTGRMYSAAIPFAKLLQLDVPIITCNGALTKCSKTDKVYDIKTIPAEFASEIVNYCEAEGLAVSIYGTDEIYTKKANENSKIHIEIDNAKPNIVENFNNQLESPLIKILFSSKDTDELEKHARVLYQRYRDKVGFFFSLPHFVEIIHKDVNKKTALENLALTSDIKREEVIAIGDNLNDMEMIEYAGLGVAMGNAPKFLKEIADFVTHSNDEDGVRYVLEKFILNKDCQEI